MITINVPRDTNITVSQGNEPRHLTLSFGEKTMQAKETMQAEIRDGKLCIEIPMTEPRLSGSGKSLVVATTSGNVESECVVNGHKVKIGLNAYIPAKAATKAA